MKRAFSIACLIIILFNFSGFYVFFCLQLSLNRQEMRRQLKYLPREQLERIILTAAEFEKAKVEDHEVRVDGRMYDIAFVEDVAGNKIVYAMHDEKEDNLLALLSFVLSTPLDKKQIPVEIQQFISLLFIPAHTRILFPESKHEDPYTPYLSSTEDLFLQQDSPPPKGKLTVGKGS